MPYRGFLAPRPKPARLSRRVEAASGFPDVPIEGAPWRFEAQQPGPVGMSPSGKVDTEKSDEFGLTSREILFSRGFRMALREAIAAVMKNKLR